MTGWKALTLRGVDDRPVAARTNGVSSSTGPVILCIHGSGYTSQYFDIAEMSMLDDCARENILCVAIDRPGYGGSPISSSHDLLFGQVAASLDTAIADLWSRVGSRHSGIVVVAHSTGGAIAVHLAARSLSWPLIGLAVSGVGDVSPSEVVSRWRSMRDVETVDLSREQRRQYLYGPAWSVRDNVADYVTESASPASQSELEEIVGAWFSDLDLLAPRIACPLQYVLAEYDALRVVSEERLQTFTAKFRNSQYVEKFIFRGSGHNIDHHLLGRTFHLQQMAFALRCSELATSAQVEAH